MTPCTRGHYYQRGVWHDGDTLTCDHCGYTRVYHSRSLPLEIPYRDLELYRSATEKPDVLAPGRQHPVGDWYERSNPDYADIDPRNDYAPEEEYL